MFHAFSCLSHLHSGCVRQRAPTEKCWSDPTIPKQPDTTSGLPTDVIFFITFIYLNITLKGLYGILELLHRTTA